MRHTASARLSRKQPTAARGMPFKARRRLTGGFSGFRRGQGAARARNAVAELVAGFSAIAGDDVLVLAGGLGGVEQHAISIRGGRV